MVTILAMIPESPMPDDAQARHPPGRLQCRGATKSPSALYLGPCEIMEMVIQDYLSRVKMEKYK